MSGAHGVNPADAVFLDGLRFWRFCSPPIPSLHPRANTQSRSFSFPPRCNATVTYGELFLQNEQDTYLHLLNAAFNRNFVVSCCAGTTPPSPTANCSCRTSTR